MELCPDIYHHRMGYRCGLVNEREPAWNCVKTSSPRQENEWLSSFCHKNIDPLSSNCTKQSISYQYNLSSPTKRRKMKINLLLIVAWLAAVCKWCWLGAMISRVATSHTLHCCWICRCHSQIISLLLLVQLHTPLSGITRVLSNDSRTSRYAHHRIKISPTVHAGSFSWYYAYYAQ